MASERESDKDHFKEIPLTPEQQKQLDEDLASDIPDDVCCCGDSMENHESPMSCGHTPVSMRAYYMSGRK